MLRYNLGYNACVSKKLILHLRAELRDATPSGSFFHSSHSGAFEENSQSKVTDYDVFDTTLPSSVFCEGSVEDEFSPEEKIYYEFVAGEEKAR